MATGGSVREINLDGNVFTVAGDAEVELHIGGYVNDVEPNGDGSGRKIMNASVGAVKGAPVNLDLANGDFETLTDLNNRTDFIPATATTVDGTIWEADVSIVDELNANLMKATAEISIKASGPFRRQI